MNIGQTFENNVCLMPAKPNSISVIAESVFHTKATNIQVSNPPIGNPRLLNMLSK